MEEPRILDRRQQGTFAIADKDREAAFWRYCTDGSIHLFYPSSSEEKARVFTQPCRLTE
jgi:hypothetical protein